MNGKRIISSLLSLAMVFSLNTGMSFAEEAQPVTEEPVVEEQVSEEPQDEVDVVPEEVVVEEQAEDVTEEVEEVEADTEQKYPAQTFTGITPDGTVSVKVEAGEGALPEGTTMYVYNVNEADISALVDSVVTGTEKTIVAANIIFLDKDGYEIEPLTDVTITLENLTAEKFEDYSLVHINQANEATLVKDTKILSLTEEKVVFTTDVFSIYAIVDDGSTIDDKERMTFYFLVENDAGVDVPFLFPNDSGNMVDNQILKNGESLQDVGLPPIHVEDNQTFNGWYYYDPDTQTFGEKVEFNTPITVTETGKTYIKANIGTSYYLTFYEDSNGGNILSKKQTGENTQYDISQQTVSVKEANLAFIGWSYESFDGDDVNQDTRQPISPTTITVTEDKELYPIFKSAYWLNFVSSQPGSGAQYVPSEYVLYNGTTVQPADPTWRGYEFAYWSTTPHVYEGTGTDTKIVNDGSSGRYTFGQPLTADTTLYAYWTPAQADYHIVYWKQSVTDSKNAEDADKTYTYFDMETLSAEAFSTVDRPASAGQKNYTGFKFNSTKSDDSVVVNADGSSVINVYYDRELVTMQFYSYNNENPGYNSDYWTNGSSRVKTITGLYGQTLTQNGESWPEGIWSFYTTGNGTQGMSYLGQFVLPDNVRDSNKLLIRLYRTRTTGNKTISIYTENVNDSGYSLDATGYGYNNSDFLFSQKYDGFSVYQYRTHTNNGWSNWRTATDGGSASLSGVDEIQVRYKRNEYTLNYLDPMNESNKLFPSVTVKYGAPLEDYEPATDPECPYPGKKFNEEGKWYADKTGGTEFAWDSTAMPNANLNVYAKWEDIWYWVKVDPNGGVIDTNTGGATWFWETYGEKVEEYGWIARNYVEDPSGTYVYQYDEFNEQDPDGTQPSTRYAQYVTGSGSPKYKEEFGAYELVGWYNVDPSTDQITSPYNFSAAITDNVYIRAIWRKIGEYKIIYDANGGSGAPVDSNKYADGSDTAILDACTPPNQNVFVGWEYNGTVYKPGDVIQVDASLANADKEITVTAVYEPYEDVPIKTTHISWYGNKYDVAGFEINGISSSQQYKSESDETPYNEEIPIANLSDLGITTQYGQYTFLGWARVNEDITEAELKNLTEDDIYLKYENGQYLAKNTSGSWVPVESVGADENQPYHAMYALWQAEFKVYHSGVSSDHIETVVINKTNLPNGTYDLTSNLTADTIYGGYYLKKTDLTESSPAYDGTNYTWTNPETAVKGTEIIPTPGETYYIKEVPVTYLLPYLQYTYKKGENTIQNLYLISAIDDLQYDSVGFEIVINKEDASVYTAVTIKAANTGTSTRFTPKNMFGLEGGYVTAYNATGYLEAGSSINVKPYWVTPDGITAFGNTERIITNDDGTISGFKYDDTVTSPSIEP